MNDNYSRVREHSKAHELLAMEGIPGELAKQRAYRQLTDKMQTGALNAGAPAKMENTATKTQKRRGFALAAALICIIGMTTAAYASGMAQMIIAHFKVGDIEITQVVEEGSDTHVTITFPDGQGLDGQGLDGQAAPTMQDGGAMQNGSAGQDDSAALAARAGRNAPSISVSEARDGLGGDFAVPQQMPEGYGLTGCVLHGSGPNKTAELQYSNAGGDMISMLVSAAENGIQTTGDVRMETIGGIEVYYVNGIVLWEYGGFTYELYHMGEGTLDDSDISGIVGSL
ncbi:MAG: DUF4367 domain-containing protein [Clostridiales Family XIII bacterium]|jgi:hypothetical protein|nr:DUF4367 domain-containing protein [Clostridiales Family XIII bacterium]